MDRSASTRDPGEHDVVSRDRILGLETEHAVLYLPDDSESEGDDPASSPSFEVLELVLFDCLLHGRKSAASAGIKGGHFLENGGLVHLEIYLRRQADTPILEACTPECRSPLDLLHYSRAFDEILDETSRRSAALLRAQGHAGRIVFGKNNLDSHGTGFGCHENYLVHHETSPAARVFFLLSLLPIFLSLFPAALLLLVVLSLFSFCLLAAKALPILQVLAGRASRWLVRRNPWGVVERARWAYAHGTNAILFPGIALYSLALRVLLLRTLLRDLTSFLACRQALCGSGSLNFKEGVYELSQRAELTRSVAEIVLFGGRKTFFDLKGFLYDPFEFFRAQKKLTVAVGDSNLADVSNFLKLGTTALVLEMLEAGVSCKDLRLRRPVLALKQVSRAGPWKELRLRTGKTMSAIAILREYLRRAKTFHARRPTPAAGKTWRQEVLTLWEESLDLLSEQPQSLADGLDWAAKKHLLDRAVLPVSNWKAFFAWGRLFHIAGLDAALEARSLDDLISRTSFVGRLRLRLHAARSRLDAQAMREHQDLYFQARKIDLRFHELGGDGYERRLEEEGLLRRLTSAEAVMRATREPPPDTRARVRSYYIRQGKEGGLVRVNWNEIEISSPARHIPLPDPFFHRLPTD